MSETRQRIPEVGEIVVGVVKKVFAHGAFVRLEGYDVEVMIHISEISPKWIKNIRDFVQEGKIVVARILRINKEKGHIDATLKGVSEDVKRKTLEARKNEQKAMKMLSTVARRIDKKPEEAYTEVGEPLEQEYGSIYLAFEEIVKDPEVLKKSGIDPKWLEPVQTIVSEQIQPKFVNILGHVKLINPTSRGIESIRNALLKAQAEETQSEVMIQYVGAPIYRIKVKSDNYKIAEADLKKVADIAISENEKYDGSGEFYRELSKIPKTE